MNVSALPLGEIPAALERDGRPPLYYGSLHLWMSVFGEGDLAGRAAQRDDRVFDLDVEARQETTTAYFPEKKGTGMILEGEPAELADQLIQILKEKTGVLA